MLNVLGYVRAFVVKIVLHSLSEMDRRKTTLVYSSRIELHHIQTSTQRSSLKTTDKGGSTDYPEY